MYRFTIKTATILCTLVLFFTALETPVAKAATISDETIQEQTLTVKNALLQTMEEQIKLLQMLLIQRLEARVAELQAQQK